MSDVALSVLTAVCTVVFLAVGAVWFTFWGVVLFALTGGKL